MTCLNSNAGLTEEEEEKRKQISLKVNRKYCEVSDITIGLFQNLILVELYKTTATKSNMTDPIQLRLRKMKIEETHTKILRRDWARDYFYALSLTKEWK